MHSYPISITHFSAAVDNIEASGHDPAEGLLSVYGRDTEFSHAYATRVFNPNEV